MKKLGVQVRVSTSGLPNFGLISEDPSSTPQIARAAGVVSPNLVERSRILLSDISPILFRVQFWGHGVAKPILPKRLLSG